MVNGRIDKYQFEEGYCQAEKSSSDNNKDIFTFYYYDQDHLGNIRQVREANGSKGYVIQTMNYSILKIRMVHGKQVSKILNGKKEKIIINIQLEVFETLALGRHTKMAVHQ